MFRRFPFFLLLVFALMAPTALCAQAPSAGHDPPPGFELYGGYSYVFRPYDHTGTNPFTGGMNGWDAALRVPVPLLGSWLGVQGEVSGIYRNDQPDFNPRTYFFLLGPEISVHLGNSTIFAHGLVGSANLNNSALPNLRSDNTLAVEAGAGLDIGFSSHWAWRIEGDYYNTNYQSTNSNVTEIVNSNERVTTGPVLRF
jgi:opacity protein-like surface antigen